MGLHQRIFSHCRDSELHYRSQQKIFSHCRFLWRVLFPTIVFGKSIITGQVRSQAKWVIGCCSQIWDSTKWSKFVLGKNGQTFVLVKIVKFLFWSKMVKILFWSKLVKFLFWVKFGQNVVLVKIGQFFVLVKIGQNFVLVKIGQKIY